MRRRPTQRQPATTIPAGPALPRPGNDNRPGTPPPAAELDCLIGCLPWTLLQNAAARARDLDIGADRVLIAWGAIDEATYLTRFARHTGISIETFSDWGMSDAVSLRDDQVRSAAQAGLVQIRRGDDLLVVIAPRRLAARELMRAIANDPGLVPTLRLAAAVDFDAFLLHQGNRALATDASYGLSHRWPTLSAAPKPMRHPHWTFIKRKAAGLALASLLTLPPDFAIGFCSQCLALWFIAAIILRFSAAFLPTQSVPKLPRLSERDLPVYTVVVALHREARVVPQLLRALNTLDYPREKLDLILAIEADDLETREAITGFGAMPHLRVMVAPDVAPRTKPKALNCVLPFARGSFIAVFDAEDQPDPGQLRAALDAFRMEADDVACAQASLCIKNATNSLFTRQFAAEYAAHFDVVLPGLAAMRLPLPLGGTSNHFRADVLREVGGWDPWNVTEDADLGLRLARFGYRAVTFPSTTQEEAPIRFMPWIKQRSRWMKGWIQTWSVHMRDPRQFRREAGWPGVMTLNLVIGANVLSALIYPVFIIALIVELARGDAGLVGGLLVPVHFIAISGGLLMTITIGLRALARRGRLRDAWILLLTPLHWACLSIATWRALWQLLHDPYRWEKTEHGLSTPANATGDLGSRQFARQR